MENFNFYCPTRIHFGAGRLDDVGEIAAKYGNICMLVTTTKNEKVLQPLFNRAINILEKARMKVIHFDGAVPNPTVQSIERGIEIVKKEKVEVIIALGGGSSIDTAKAISLFHGLDKIKWKDVYGKYDSPFKEYKPISKKILPLISIPTTSGTGSELTQAMIISDENTKEKLCIFHDKVFPLECIIDSQLTQTLPRKLTCITGFDAFCHAFESFVRKEASIYTQTIGLKAMELIINTLLKVLDYPENEEYRDLLSQAEMFAGISLANAAATIPHPLSEIIGGIAPNIAHGQALICLYPGFLEYQINITPEKCAQVSRLFDSELNSVSDEVAASKLPNLMRDFISHFSMETSLRKLGVKEENLILMETHNTLKFLPFASEADLKKIMRSAF